MQTSFFHSLSGSLQGWRRGCLPWQERGGPGASGGVQGRLEGTSWTLYLVQDKYELCGA